MADRDDLITCALREVTRAGGPSIWNDPGRLRSRLQFEIGPVSSAQSAVLDAVVIAAMQRLPRALLDHEDLQPHTLGLSDAVGPLLGAQAVSIWMRALADPEPEPEIDPEPEPEIVLVDDVEPEPVIESDDVEPEPEPEDDDRPLTLIDRLRPPPPVPVLA
jgi:hypothetical protein